jgi:phospholipid transport system transporter-binding protein
VISRRDDTLLVSGRLTMDTANALFDIDLHPQVGASLEIDFGQVEAVDSAAVSLLLCWLRRAQHDNIALVFSRLPDNLLSLARLYGVAELLPAAGAAPALHA